MGVIKDFLRWKFAVLLALCNETTAAVLIIEGWINFLKLKV
jgi:hypothetical protein